MRINVLIFCLILYASVTALEGAPFIDMFKKIPILGDILCPEDAPPDAPGPVTPGPDAPTPPKETDPVVT